MTWATGPKLGLWGARADGGGLATMTWEFHRNVRPDRTMVIDLGPSGRGPSHLDRYPGAMVNGGMNEKITVDTCRRFLDGLDVVYAAETWYRDDFCQIARDMGVATVLHVMPELYRADQAPADVLWAPTSWELGRLPKGTTIVPVPVARDRLRPRTVNRGAQVFLFVGAPAFHDRNGYDLLIAAVPRIERPVEIIFAGTPEPPVVHRGQSPARVTWEPGQVLNYWDRYPERADVLVLPRRYAGLSLPMQEAASLGMPIITLDLPPQNEWLPRSTIVPARPHHIARMVNGKFPVYACTPETLAARIDHLAARPDVTTDASLASKRHAAELSWDHWAPKYRALLASTATNHATNKDHSRAD